MAGIYPLLIESKRKGSVCVCEIVKIMFTLLNFQIYDALLFN